MGKTTAEQECAHVVEHGIRLLLFGIPPKLIFCSALGCSFFPVCQLLYYGNAFREEKGPIFRWGIKCDMWHFEATNHVLVEKHGSSTLAFMNQTMVTMCNFAVSQKIVHIFSINLTQQKLTCIFQTFRVNDQHVTEVWKPPCSSMV